MAIVSFLPDCTAYILIESLTIFYTILPYRWGDKLKAWRWPKVYQRGIFMAKVHQPTKGNDGNSVISTTLHCKYFDSKICNITQNFTIEMRKEVLDLKMTKSLPKEGFLWPKGTNQQKKMMAIVSFLPHYTANILIWSLTIFHTSLTYK